MRELRRRTAHVTGTQTLTNGETRELDAQQLAEPLERALRVLWLALVLLAIGARGRPALTSLALMIIPAATVSLVDSSMRMKLPVVRLRQ